MHDLWSSAPYVTWPAGMLLQDYMRVPITDEKAPKDSDFELLIQRLWNVPLDAALVFNCQMGRGRTTTGMVIATLLTLRRLGAFPVAQPPPTVSPPTAAIPSRTQQNGSAAVTAANGSGCLQQDGRSASKAAAQLTAIPAWFTKSRAARRSGSGGGAVPGSPTTPRGPVTGEAKLKGGMYGVIRSLLRVLERGVTGKAILDAVIDACSAMQVSMTEWVMLQSPAVASYAAPVFACLNLWHRMAEVAISHNPASASCAAFDRHSIVQGAACVSVEHAYSKASLQLDCLQLLDCLCWCLLLLVMQNLREAIATYRGRLMAESKESRRATLMGVCLEYLERYYMLLAFTSYLTWPKFDPASPGYVTFQDWMETRPELRSVLSRMLRR